MVFTKKCRFVSNGIAACFGRSYFENKIRPLIERVDILNNLYASLPVFAVCKFCVCTCTRLDSNLIPKLLQE